jgi:hypothetical protein
MYFIQPVIKIDQFIDMFRTCKSQFLQSGMKFLSQTFINRMSKHEGFVI